MRKLDSYNIVSKGVTVASSLTEEDVRMILTGKTIDTKEPIDTNRAHGMIRNSLDFNDYQIEQAYLHKGVVRYKIVTFTV